MHVQGKLRRDAGKYPSVVVQERVTFKGYGKSVRTFVCERVVLKLLLAVHGSILGLQ